MTLTKISRPMLILGLVLTTVGILLAFALDHQMFGNGSVLEILPLMFLAALLLGAALAIIGCVIMPTRLAPPSQLVLGLGFVAFSFGLAFLLDFIGIGINVHRWTVSFFLPVAIAFCAGCIFFARGWSNWGRGERGREE
jgi:hypothetical protein